MDYTPTDLDLTGTPFDNPDDVTVLDVNGTTYLVGEDAHGWFSIMHAEIHAIEGRDDGFPVEGLGDYPLQSFDRVSGAILADLLDDYL